MSTDGRSEPSAPKRRLLTQLWFLVLAAIAAGIALGLVAPEPLGTQIGLVLLMC